MQNDNSVTELVKVLSNSRIVLSGEIDSVLLEDIDIDILANRIIESKNEAAELTVLTPIDIQKFIENIKIEKAPLPIEVIRPAGFKPIAADVDASYSIAVTPRERAEGTTLDFVEHFKSRLYKIRQMIELGAAGGKYGMLKTLEGLKNLAAGREVSVVGLVTDRFVSKKGNVVLTLEDETGEAKIMFMNGTSQQAKELFDQSNHIINDEVIAISGKIFSMSGGMGRNGKSVPFMMANSIIWPDVPIRQKKTVEDDIAIAFMSDIHVGSKRFLEKSFKNMIQWLNGGGDAAHKELAGKIKYVVMAGDVADGIGVYPGQERDLAVPDIYMQYRELFNYIDAIPDYIHVFVLPGNHDAVQRAEPQPPLGEDIVKDFKRDNVHILSNPSYATMHGLDVLAYHGTSLDDIIASVPGLSYAHPEKAMIELLKRRHISPVYGRKNVIVPSKNDNLVIERIPDILHMGHIHKNGVASYHGVEVVNSGTWQARTDFQIAQGHIPTPGVLPVYEAKSHTFTSINFLSE